MAHGLLAEWIQKTYMFYYVYVLWCVDTKRKRHEFYTGSTDNLRARFKQHASGLVKTTKSFTYVELIYYEACKNSTDARKRELQLKTGFGRGFLKRRLAEYLKKRD